MGQYFVPVNLDKKEYLNAHLFDCGLKLTETCYVGNSYIDALTYLLSNDWHGDNVILCGDYAWEAAQDLSDATGRGSAADALLRLADRDPYEASDAFRDRSTDFAASRGGTVMEKISETTYAPVPVQGTFHIDAGHCQYVADLTQGVFYDREKAPVAFTGTWKGEPYITRTDPLSIFMAVGNGLGGGDYHGPNMGMVGSWAGHAIMASQADPGGIEGFREIACPFDENGVFLTATDDEIRRAVECAGLDWNRASVADLADAVASLEEGGCDLDLEARDLREASDGLSGPSAVRERDDGR